jgi:hypothetical protein
MYAGTSPPPRYKRGENEAWPAASSPASKAPNELEAINPPGEVRIKLVHSPARSTDDE